MSFLRFDLITLIVIFYVADMRKALSRDVHRKSVIPLKDPVRPEDVE